MNIEDFINSRMDVIFAGLLQNNAEYALTYHRYEHLCELTDPVVCQRKDIEISGEECESFALGVQRAIWFFGAETPQSGVILVAGREPICLVCLAAGAFLLPKNSAGMLPLVHRGYDCMIAQRVAFRLIIPLFSGKSCIRKYSCCCLPAAFPGNAR